MSTIDSIEASLQKGKGIGERLEITAFHTEALAQHKYQEAFVGIASKMWQVTILLLHVAQASKVGAQPQLATSNEKDNTKTVLHHDVRHLSPGDMIIGGRDWGTCQHTLN